MRLRIATFNVENLFSRFDFEGRAARRNRIVGAYAFEAGPDYDVVRKSFEAVASDDMRQLTALAIAETRADVICLQEVDSAPALDLFYENYLKPVLHQAFARATKGLDAASRDRVSPEYFYDHRVVLPGNDSRGIDVAVMARHPFSATSNAGLTFGELAGRPPPRQAPAAPDDGDRQRVFRRDCLTIEAGAGDAPLTLFVCHLKSMQPPVPGSDGRQRTRAVREAEARAVRALVEARFGEAVAASNWAICGDLNDYVEIDGEKLGGSALGPLLDDGFAVNVMERRPPLDRWTHYFTGSDACVQLDYILLSPRLARENPRAVPEVIRKGQPWRVPRLEDAPRWPRVGWARPKASDHCPVVIEIDVRA